MPLIKIPQLLQRFYGTFCGGGLIIGTLFFAASLTPSLLPRSEALQGVLSGASFAAGYGIGVGLRALWYFLGFRNVLSPYASRIASLIAIAACSVIALAFLWQASHWQNSIRVLMGLDTVETIRPFFVGAISVAVAIALLLIGRLFKLTFGYLARMIDRIAPRRVSNLLALVFSALLFWSLGSGVFLEAGLRLLDGSYKKYDALVSDEEDKPTDPLKSGSAESVLRWEDLGRAGREAISSSPTRSEISNFTGQDAKEPIRVYVGLNSADDIETRVRLALEEMIRVGAFERSVVVIATPTGTGWLDPASHMPLEYLHRGDTATVSVQYSYLASWLALMVEPDYGAETSKAVFRVVYDHWLQLPETDRPKLYLHGLSLGAMNSDLSYDLFDIVGQPFDGALWAGPPFTSRTWKQATAGRNEGSPAWMPRFRDGTVIRFTGQDNYLDQAEAPWGPLRVVFLQYASDPITFFEPNSMFRAPAWMRNPRGPDVSPSLQWFPVVTFLQLALDMAIATSTPMGHGHVYAPEHYVDAWVAVTQPQGWSPQDLQRLKDMLASTLKD
jgi:uncharacterized membrane protein